jgi:thiamine pyrophosphate-dependent acetolactate synthase large subunit-like protein
MVAVQEEQKYGRSSGTFRQLDPAKYAEAFGAHGLMIHSPAGISAVLKKPFDQFIEQQIYLLINESVQRGFVKSRAARGK